jgi:hypothetical protein
MSQIGLNSFMTNFNFDYFEKRATILTEMAGNSMFSIYSNVNDAYKALRKYLNLKHGYNASSSLDLVVYRYVFNLLEDYNVVSEEQKSAYDNLPKGRGPVVEFVDNIFKKLLNSGKVDKARLIADLKDESKIDEFANNLKVGKGNRATGLENHIELVTHKPKEYLDALAAKLAPYLKKMNMMRSIRSRSKSTPDEPIDTSGLPEDFYNEDPDVMDTIYDLIETIKKESDQADAEGDPMDLDLNILNQIQDKFLTPRKNAGKGIRRDQFVGYLTKLLDLPNLDETQEHTLTTLLDEFDTIYETMGEIDNQRSDFGQIYRIATSGKSGKKFGYDLDIIDKVLQSDELKDDFDNYMTLKKKLDEQDPTIKRGFDSAIEDFFNRPGKGGITRYIDDENPTSKSKDTQIQTINKIIDSIEQKLQNPKLDPETRKALEKDYMKQLEREKALNPKKQDEDEEELSTFSYMTEQVDHDKKFSDAPKNKFTERKFKKFTNYNHWLEMNS